MIYGQIVVQNMSEVNRQQPETMLEEIVRNDKPSREERDKLAKRKVLIGYAFGLIVCIILNGYLFSLCYKHYLAYVKSSCFILNSTVVETNSQFSARWSVNISQDHFVPHHYLGQINKKFSFYHEAQEIISTTHLVSLNAYHLHLFGISFHLDWISGRMLRS